MSLGWLWLIIPVGYGAMWYLTARFFVRIETISEGRPLNDASLNYDIFLALIWPVMIWIFLAVYGAEPLRQHFRRTALPKSRRPAPDLRATRESKQLRPR